MWRWLEKVLSLWRRALENERGSLVLGDSKYESFHAVTSLELKYPLWKGAMDYLLATALFLLTLPLMLLIAILVKLEDGGPVFFLHERVGAKGRKFKLIKFRTMCQDAERKLKELLERDPELRAEWEANYKLKNDPRVTKIGRFLRRTSLDELPQLINVLKGEMSLVGPRPVTEEEFKKFYSRVADKYTSVKPGLTGYWQVKARSDCESYEKRVEMDVWYVDNMSLMLDLKILIETVLVVLTARGGY